MIPAFGLACVSETLVDDGPTRDPVITPGGDAPAGAYGYGGYHGGYAPDDE